MRWPPRRLQCNAVPITNQQDTPVSRASAFLAHNNMFRAGPIPVESFSLFSSFLSAQPTYEVVELLVGLYLTMRERGVAAGP